MSKLLRVILRADGDSQTGLGHVTRLLSLAETLRYDFHCTLISRNLPDALHQRVADAGATLLNVPNNVTLTDEVEWLVNLLTGATCIVVLDGYHFDVAYHRTIRSAGHKLVVVDDVPDAPVDADVILNHGGGLSPANYHVPLYTKLALGPAFALLHPAFSTVSRSKKPVSDIVDVLLCFGGADPQNLTGRVLERLATLPNVRINVVIGAAYSYQDELSAVAITAPDFITIHRNVAPSKLAALLTASDWAITSASSVAYEAATVGVGLLVAQYVPNQEKLYKFLTEKDLAIGLHSLSEPDLDVMAETIRGTDPRLWMARQRSVFTPSGLTLRKLFGKLLLEQDITLRSVQPADCDILFSWANDPGTRQFALYPEPIDYDTHCMWFSQKLQSATPFYIADRHGQPVGQVRFDPQPNEWVVSFGLAPMERRRGLGEAMLRLALQRIVEEESSLPAVRAVVYPDNVASMRVFLALGFQKQLDLKWHDQAFYQFVKFNSGP